MKLFGFEQIEPILRGKGESTLTPARVIQLLKKQKIWFGLDSSNRPWTNSIAIERAIDQTGSPERKTKQTDPTSPEITFL